MTHSITPTPEQTARYDWWYQKEQTDEVPLLEAVPIVSKHFETSEDSKTFLKEVYEFVCGVVNEGRQGVIVTRDLSLR
jgi:hypothetical protein